MLKYFKSEQDYKNLKPPKGVINFSQIWVQVDLKETQYKIDLKIMGSNRVFNLRCPNADVYEVWSRKLQYAVNSSLGKIKQLSMEKYKHDINSKFDFWRFLRLEEESFLL